MDNTSTKAEKRSNTQFLMDNLDAIIAVGYRVNSIRATQFRQWATSVLRQYAIRGYVLDKKRMENGTFLGEDYFEHLLAEIREIRLSERRFYQKLTDIYATSMDYNKDAPTTAGCSTRKSENKMHYPVHGCTAAELIMERLDADKEHMGLPTWENAPAEDGQDRASSCRRTIERDGTGGHGAHRDGCAGVCSGAVRSGPPRALLVVGSLLSCLGNPFAMLDDEAFHLAFRHADRGRHVHVAILHDAHRQPSRSSVSHLYSHIRQAVQN